MRVHFGNMNDSDQQTVWDLFWEDCKDAEWDSAPLLLVANLETRSSILFEDVEQGDLLELVHSAKRYLTDISAIMVYAEGWGVKAPKGASEREALQGVPPSRHPDRMELKMATIMSADLTQCRMKFREGDEEEVMDEGGVYNPMTAFGEVAVAIRKEMEW